MWPRPDGGLLMKWIPVYIVYLATPTNVFAYPPQFMSAVRAAAQAAPGANLMTNAVYRIDTPATCYKSAEDQAAAIANQNRLDIHYLNPKICNIHQVRDPVPAAYRGVGTIIMKGPHRTGDATAELVKVDEIGPNSGQIILTTMHSFVGEYMKIPDISAEGVLNNSSRYRFYSSTCKKSYKIQSICGPPPEAYMKRAKDDYAFAVLDKPLCDDAKASAFNMRALNTANLDAFQQPEATATLAELMPQDVCVQSPNGEFDDTEEALSTPASPDKMKMFISRGPVLSKSDDGSTLFSTGSDIIKGASGGPILAYPDMDAPLLLGISVKEEPANVGLGINQEMIDKYKECYKRVVPQVATMAGDQ
jgi:hypothetical protein